MYLRRGAALLTEGVRAVRRGSHHMTLAQQRMNLAVRAIPSDGSPAATDAVERRRKLGFLVLCAGFVMSSLDMMVVNVAFPAISDDFRGSTTGGLSWTLSAYSVVFASLLVPAGRLADRASKKTAFLAGLALFTVASAICAAAVNVPMLIAARVLQACGAAAMVPTSLGLLLASYPADRRQSAVRAWTAVGGFSAALAPIVGGALVNVDWRWIFLVNLPVGAGGALLGGKVLPDLRVAGPTPLPDFRGSLLAIASVSLLSLGFVKAPDWGWLSWQVLASLATAVALVLGFLRRCANHPSPVIPLGLVRERRFALANVSAFAFTSCFAAMLISLVLWCENAWGYSALQTGLAMAPGTFLMPFVALKTGRLIARFGAADVIAAGCLLLAAGVASWAALARFHSSYWTLLPGAVLTPVGSILGTTAIIGIVTQSLPPALYATGSAINQMIRQIGMAIGVSVFVAALGHPTTANAAQHSFQRAWLISSGLGVIAALAALALAVAPESRQTLKAQTGPRHRKTISSRGVSRRRGRHSYPARHAWKAPAVNEVRT